MSSSTTKASKVDKSAEATQVLNTQRETPRPKEDNVRLLAYEKWEKAGSPTGDDETFWFEAENELIENEEFE
jgi:hypothetical protein